MVRQTRQNEQLAVRTGYQAWIAEPRRARSPELDFGVWWHWPGQRWSTWRVSWIDETGELYARELAYDSDRFVVLGCFHTRDAVEAFMQGWSAGERRKELTWITQRMV